MTLRVVPVDVGEFDELRFGGVEPKLDNGIHKVDDDQRPLYSVELIGSVDGRLGTLKATIPAGRDGKAPGGGFERFAPVTVTNLRAGAFAFNGNAGLFFRAESVTAVEVKRRASE